MISDTSITSWTTRKVATPAEAVQSKFQRFTLANPTFAEALTRKGYLVRWLPNHRLGRRTSSSETSVLPRALIQRSTRLA